MRVVAIDPGATESGVVEWDGGRVVKRFMLDNTAVLNEIAILDHRTVLAIEQVRGYGMTAGNELFDTVWWSGRFYQSFQTPLRLMVPRKDVKLHLCGNTTAKDKDVREALLYRFGPQGSKKAPGLLYGVSGHCWQALALAVYVVDTRG